MVDDTFLLASRALSTNPRVLVPLLPAPGGGDPHLALSTLVDVAMFGSLTQHREACNSVLGFLVSARPPHVHPCVCVGGGGTVRDGAMAHLSAGVECQGGSATRGMRPLLRWRVRRCA